MALSNLNQVRLLIGDTDSADQVLSDAQVQHFLDDNGDDVDLAAPAAARAVYAVLAVRAASQTTGPYSIDLTRRAEAYKAFMSAMGWDVSDATLAGPYVGGVATADIDTWREDDSVVQPAFTHDLHERSDDDDPRTS